MHILTIDDSLLSNRRLIVADVVETIVSHRPYRPALGSEAAIREIERNRGSLYDPGSVAARLDLFRKKNFNWEGV